MNEEQEFVEHLATTPIAAAWLRVGCTFGQRLACTVMILCARLIVSCAKRLAS